MEIIYGYSYIWANNKTIKGVGTFSYDLSKMLFLLASEYKTPFVILPLREILVQYTENIRCAQKYFQVIFCFSTT